MSLLPRISLRYYPATVLQLALAVVALWVTRPWFYAFNSQLVGEVSGAAEYWSLMWSGLRFDLTAAVYFNALFILLRFLPWPRQLPGWYMRLTDWIWYVTNFVMLALNVADIPFFRFTGARMRWSSLCDVFSESNIGGVMLSYMRDFWWAYLGAALLYALTVVLYRMMRPQPRRAGTTLRCILCIAALALSFLAIRGKAGGGRPFGIADAVWCVDRNSHINVVLNTPFCILRSLSKGDGSNTVEQYSFYSEEELKQLRDDVRGPANLPYEGTLKGRNIVVIVMESGSQHFIDTLNRSLGRERRGLMPFLDSIAGKSLVVEHLMASGRRSNEGILSIFGGFMNFAPLQYILSPYNANTIDSPPRLLAQEGYDTKFYFGGNKGSFNIDQILGVTGFSKIASRQTYGDDSDFDGVWGIFDHAMGAYAARDLSTLQEPFLAGWFTIDAHSPFPWARDWNSEGYLSPEGTAQRSIEYTDRSIRHFFEVARTQPWYANTAFVITADHGCRDMMGTKYDSPYIMYHLPFIIYTPGGEIPTGRVTDRVMSQWDIAPSLLSLAGYPHRFLSPGASVFDDRVPHYGLSMVAEEMRITGPRYQFVAPRALSGVTAVYDILADPECATPILPGTAAYPVDEAAKALAWARALLQDWHGRIATNRMSEPL